MVVTAVIIIGMARGPVDTPAVRHNLGPVGAGCHLLGSAHLRARPLDPYRPPAAVRGKLKKAGPIANLLFNAAYNYKLFLLKRGLPFG